MCKEKKKSGFCKACFVAAFLFFLCFVLLTPPSQGLVVGNGSNEGFMSLEYANAPFVFKNQTNLLIVHIVGNSSESLQDASVNFSLSNETYPLFFNSYYDGYPVSIFVYPNESITTLGYSIIAAKENYTFAPIIGIFKVSNFSIVTVRLFKDVEGKNAYNNRHGYIFASPITPIPYNNTEYAKKLISPIIWFSEKTLSFLTGNESTYTKYSTQVFYSKYEFGKAVMGLPSEQDYAFYFVAGNFRFSDAYFDYPYYSSKNSELKLYTERVEGTDNNFSYQVTDWDLNFWLVIGFYVVLFLLVFVGLPFAYLASQQEGSMNILGKYCLFLLVGLPFLFLGFRFLLWAKSFFGF